MKNLNEIMSSEELINFEKSTSYWIHIYPNLEYGDTKSGQLEDWLVKKICFICMQSKKKLKGIYVEIQFSL